MPRTILITGAASGIGLATAERLRAAGHRVIGADVRDTEITGDLGTDEGRQNLVEQASRLAPEGLDAVMVAAGIGNPQLAPQLIAVNYFGAVATVEGLRPLLARGTAPRVVLITSTSALLPSDEALVQACLDHDEARARSLASPTTGNCYGASKRALTLWLRREAAKADWAGAGILMNGLAPGLIETPMTGGMLRDPKWIDIIKQSNPVAIDGLGQPEEIAELADYLLNYSGRWMVGQNIYVDGGTDVLLRPENL